MKKLIYSTLAVCYLVVTGAMTFNTPSYEIKQGFLIEFKSKDPSGVFKVLKGNVNFDENDLEGSKFNFTIPINSISTGNGMMNKKAQTEEWFYAEKHPEIKYVSHKIEKTKQDSYLVDGTLTIKGVSRNQKVPLKLTKHGNELIFKGDFAVNRIDFKVGKKSDAVPDFMNISYTLPVTKK